MATRRSPKNRRRPTRAAPVARPTMSVTLPAHAVLGGLLKSYGIDFQHGGGWLSLLGGRGRDTEELTDAYQQDSWVIACVNLFLTVVPAPRLRIYDRDPDDEDAQEVLDGPVHELFHRVNDYMSPASFALHVAQQITLSGDSLVVFRDKMGNPLQASGGGARGLIDVPHDMVPVVGSAVGLDCDPATNEPRTWKVSTGASGARDWPVASALALYELPDPQRPFRGIGRVAQAWGAAAQTYLAQRYQNFILRNRGEYGGFVEINGLPVGSPEFRAAETEVEAEYNNPANSGKTKVISGDAKYKANPTTPKDLEYGALRSANKQDVSAVMQTPAGLLGDNVENYATFAGRMQMYLTSRLKPYLTTQADQWNSGFFPRLRDRKLSQYRVRFDTEELDGLFRDPSAVATALKALQETGLSMDQARRVVGIKADPHPGSEVPMAPAGLVPLEVAILQAKAHAAAALQTAGVDGARAFELVGLDAEFADPLGGMDLEADAAAAPGAAGVAGAEVVADTAFNGAQVSAAQAIVAEAAAGKIPRESAHALLVTFFLLTPEQADAILGPIGNGFEPKPDPVKPAPFGGGPPGGSPASEPANEPAGEDDEEEEPKPAPADDKALPAPRTRTAGDIAARRRVQALQRTIRNQVNARIRKVLLDERRAQIAALEQFAETGRIDRALACNFPACSITVRPDEPAELIPLSAPPTLPEAALVSLAQAVADDAREEAELLAMHPEALLADVVIDCCGTTERRQVPWEKRQRKWLRRYAWGQRAGLQRCRDLALLHKAQLSELEINQLLIVNDRRWQKAIAEKLTPLLAKQYRQAAEDHARELGIGVIDVTSPDVLAKFAARAVQVAEGNQSVLAARIRSALIEVAAQHGTTGTLQEIVKETLVEMKAATTGAFNSHASRALAVARTETAGATNGARFDQQVQARTEGSTDVSKWLTSGQGPEESGGTVRASHYALEGVTTVPGVPFVTGAGNRLLYPLDPSGPPEEIVNCGCIASLVPEGS